MASEIPTHMHNFSIFMKNLNIHNNIRVLVICELSINTKIFTIFICDNIVNIVFCIFNKFNLSFDFLHIVCCANLL